MPSPVRSRYSSLARLAFELPRNLLLMLLPVLAAHAAPLTVDISTPPPPAKSAPYGPGTSRSPEGREITMDSRSFFLDGTPWIPIAGEFHYSRYPRAEWRDELLKMKAGGISVVSTYVFWIHQEEVRGKFDWTGQRSLRDFLTLCQQVGLKAVVRLGPWAHGEVRNGGFPDWVQHSGTKLRTADPAFLALVKPFYEEESRQMKGLLWKDGGPVIGVQLDNECGNIPYLLALKKLARDVGIDVPFYTITGWSIKIPSSGLLPLFGGYADGFWGGTADGYRKEFFFNDTRAINDLGAQLTSKNRSNDDAAKLFPYACAEIGPGMMCSYKKRIDLPADVYASLALSKLGSGNNMPGYYMYQGGTNPDSEAQPPTSLQEDHPNFLPLKDYDFHTALGACGQVREQYHLLREQHLFLNDFGAAFARMIPYFPDARPEGVKDFDTLRWDVRSDGASGYVFFNNNQPYLPLPAHEGVQFAIKTAKGEQLVPRRSITIPSGAYGFFPFNLDCDGVTLEYATAQPLCKVDASDNAATYFFAAIGGIAPELVLRREDGTELRAHDFQPGLNPVATARAVNGKTVQFVVLSPEQARSLWKTTFAGRERAILSEATVLTDGAELRLQADQPAKLALSIFPPLASVEIGGARLSATEDGVFARFVAPAIVDAPTSPVKVALEHPASAELKPLRGMDEAAWGEAAVYTLSVPKSLGERPSILNIHYLGDAARVYVGDRLFADDFYNGEPMPVALWRIPAKDWSKITLRVLPYSDALASRLPDEAKVAAAAAKAAGTENQVSVTVTQPHEVVVSAGDVANR